MAMENSGEKREGQEVNENEKEKEKEKEWAGE
jgi:hypothetical protein